MIVVGWTRVGALTAAVAALLVAGCGGGGETEAVREPVLRVLFVGNSLTDTNDLPATVSDIAERAGAGPLETEVVAPGGVSLEDHWTATGARERLEGGEWDVVVLQQGPSSLPQSRAHLVRWAGRWADLAREHGVRPALLTVWPEAERATSLPDVIASYAAAARASGALLLPAGEAWQAAWARDPELSLHGADGLHPSELGTGLAALVVYAGLTGTEPEALAGIDLPGVDEETAALLRDAAAQALGS